VPSALGVAARDFNQFANTVAAELRELWDRFTRTPQLPPGETTPTLPPLASRQNMGVCFDANGYFQPCASVPSTTISAGSGITFTGTNPTTISITPTPTTVSPVIPSRAVATTLDLHTLGLIQTGGYAAGGDGGGGHYVQVGSQSFCGPYTDTSAFQDSVGTWFKLSEPLEFNIRQFGAKQDSVYGVSGTDDTAAVQSAFRCAGVQTGAGDDVGGGAGKTVRVPAGWSLISSVVTIPNQVPVVGVCPICNGFDMATAFATNTHFFILGDQFTQTDVAASQSRGSAGNLTLNASSQWYRGGTIYLLHPQVPAIYSASTNTGVNFTFSGTDRFGNAQTDTIAGPAAGGVANSTKFWSTITQASTNGATGGNVSIGFPQIATFGTRLENLELFSGNINATQFSTSVNNPSSPTPTAGLLGNAMAYSNSAQHTGGVKNVKIFAGNRNALFIEMGVGGASNITIDDLESFNQGNCGSCASNNSQIKLAYNGDILVPLNRIVMGGPGAGGGVAAKGIEVDGGRVQIFNSHAEGMAIGHFISFSSINTGSVVMQNITGGSAMTDSILIDNLVPSNSVYISAAYPNGATHTINNRGTPVTGNQMPWTLY
jgi:hypothetical protein